MNPTLSFVCARPGPAVANARINPTTSHVFIQRIVALPSTPRTQGLALHADDSHPPPVTSPHGRTADPAPRARPAPARHAVPSAPAPLSKTQRASRSEEH